MRNANRVERRDRQRWDFSSRPRVLDQDTGILQGYLVDIHSKGMRLVGEQPTIPGRDYQLLVEISQEGNQVEQVSLIATSVWTRRRPDQDLPYESGFRFAQTIDVILV